MENRKLHICIDCGGSKTAAAVAALIGPAGDPTIVGRGYAGPSNYKDNGLKVFIAAVRTAAVAALTQAIGTTIDLPSLDTIVTTEEYNHLEDKRKRYLYSAWVGASGIDAQEDIRILTPILSRMFGIPQGLSLVVANDSHIFSSPLLMAPPSVRGAVVAIAGTGSVVVGFRKQQISQADSRETVVQLSRAGGWGYLLGDDGSGFFAGKEAVREVLRLFYEKELDGGEEPNQNGGAGGIASKSVEKKETLTSMLMTHFKLNSPDELFSVVYAPDSSPDIFADGQGGVSGPAWSRLDRKQRFVSLAPLVFRAAFELKDEAALRALRISVNGLAGQISSVCVLPNANIDGSYKVGRRVHASSSLLCLGGSLFKVPEYRSLLIEELASMGQSFSQVVYVEDACTQGALGLAKSFS